MNFLRTRYAIALLGATTFAAHAVPVTYSISATHYVDASVTNLPNDVVVNNEIGFGRQNISSPTLPNPLTNYTANIPSSGVGGTFNLCASNGVDCVFGDIVGLTGQTPLGVFAHTSSTSVITGGSGIYAGATGSWSNNAYIIGSGNTYSLYNFTDGSLTQGGTTHVIKGGAFVDGSVAPTKFNETGYREATLTPDAFPVALDRYTAMLVSNTTDVPPLSTTTGDFEWCSTDGADCIKGIIDSFEQLSPRGLWNHVRSVSTVTSGTGAYANTAGTWTNDTYFVGYFDGGPRYGLFSFAEGRLTVSDVPAPGTLALMVVGGAALRRRCVKNRL